MAPRKKAAEKAVEESVVEDAEAPAEEPVETTDASVEVERGPLEGVASDDGTQDVHVPLGTTVDSVGVEVGDENPPSPEEARGPLDATPSESIRHHNL